MKQYKTHTNRNQFSKTITITTKYSERICSYKQTSSGGSFVVDFRITVQPNDSDQVVVFCDDYTQTLAAIQYISEGIDNYLDHLRQQNAILQGVDILIENVIINMVDFKSIRYTIETMKFLRRIGFTHGIHVLSQPFDSAIQVLEFPKTSIWNLFDGLQVRKEFILPNTSQQVLKLPENTLLRKEFSYDDSRERISVELATHIYTQRHANNVYLYADHNPESIQLFLLAEDALRKVIKDV